MLPPLHVVVGLPQECDLATLHGAFEERFSSLLARSSHGDPSARTELVNLRLAYLNWAYVRRES